MIPSLRSIQYFSQRWVSDAQCLPSTTIDEKFKGIDVRIDTLNELGQMIRLSKEHVAKAVEVEERLPVPTTSFERALQLHARLIEQYQGLAFQLGVDMPADMATVPIRLSGKVEVEAGPTIRELLDKFGLKPEEGE